MEFEHKVINFTTTNYPHISDDVITDEKADMLGKDEISNEDEALQQAIMMSMQSKHSATSANSAAVSTAFFQQPFSDVDEWQRQIQANYAPAQQTKAAQEGTDQKKLSK